MNSNWESKSIGQICSIKRGASPRPIHEWMTEDDGIPWVKISDATLEKSNFINKTASKIKNGGNKRSVEVFPGDLILSNSATPGIPKIMGIYACIHDGWLLLRDFKKVKKEFLFYFLEKERPKLLAKGNGSVFKNLKTDILREHQICFPTINDQTLITNFLGSLDEKITLNKKTIENLENISKALFKSWFIDFNPVRAKAEGETTGIPDEISDFFPDSFEDSELGEIPKGWNISSLGECSFHIESGKRPKGGIQKDLKHGIPSLGAESIDSAGLFDFGKVKYVTEEFANFATNGWVENFDVALYKDGCGRGGEPGRFNPRVAIYGDDFPFKNFMINEHVFLLRSKELGQPFLYNLFDSRIVREQIIHMGSSKGAQPGLNQKEVASCIFVKPNQKSIHFFNHLSTSFLKKQFFLGKRNMFLTKLRDTLLPKLISGELRIPDAEKMIEEIEI